jgi:hypothetical protein
MIRNKGKYYKMTKIDGLQNQDSKSSIMLASNIASSTRLCVEVNAPQNMHTLA